MDSGIMPGVFAVIGSGITFFFQARAQKAAHEFHLLEQQQAQKFQGTQEKSRLTREHQHKAHRHLSAIQRAFSPTGLFIARKAGTKSAEYDQAYLVLCQEVDELRAIVDLHAPSLSESVHELDGQMNIYGSFRN